MKKKMSIWVTCIILTLIIAISLSLVSRAKLKSLNEKLKQENEMLIEFQVESKVELKSLKLEKINLHNKNVELEVAASLLQKKYKDDKLPSSLSIEILKSKGIDDYNIILKDLKNQTKMIGYEGVLGGTMMFIVEESKILNEKYVLAYFEDGHIAGYTLLSYSINEKLDIEWNVLESELIN